MNESNTQDKNPVQHQLVLIVDDEEIVTQSLSSFLELETDYEIVTFQSPLKAVEFLKKRQADLVISDFLMPDINGLEFLTQVKKMYPDTTRIILTGYADKQNAIKAINEIGIYHYIEKPWDNDELKLIIKNSLENKSLKGLLKEKIHLLDETLKERQQLIVSNDMFQAELKLAKRVQQGMLPQSLPENNSISLTAIYQPALEIGGDFYDIISLDNDRIAILIADATGHGVQAALSTALLKFAFSSFRGQEVSPSEILEGMNLVLYNGLPKDIFVVALVVTVDVKTGQCQIVNSGIPYPIYINREKNKVEMIQANGLILGMADEDLYQPGDVIDIELNKNDSLLVFTDGLSETKSETDEMFDNNVLVETIEKKIPNKGSKIIDDLLLAASGFRESEQIEDDITLLCLDKN
ncbi:MAG: SpoIIE family protein phosphatase [Candidatus Zixiibacteriota bacterium]